MKRWRCSGSTLCNNAPHPVQCAPFPRARLPRLDLHHILTQPPQLPIILSAMVVVISWLAGKLISAASSAWP